VALNGSPRESKAQRWDRATIEVEATLSRIEQEGDASLFVVMRGLRDRDVAVEKRCERSG
jgi:hypothetical protein